VDEIHTALIKPGHSFDAPSHRRRGRLQPRRRERIAQDVAPPRGSDPFTGTPRDAERVRPRDAPDPFRTPELAQRLKLSPAEAVEACSAFVKRTLELLGQ
jgi:hypothetical protein